MNEKFLYFAVSAPNDAGANEQVAMFPASNVSHFEIAETTKLDVWFKTGTSQEKDEDSGQDNIMVRLLITATKHKEVMEALAGAIASAGAINAPMIVVADSENSKFLHANITACESINVVDAS